MSRTIKKTKTDLFELRKLLVSNDNTNVECALNMALIYIQNPSPETLQWVKHYLAKHIKEHE